jgi:type I restriction enzyme S subunit
MNNWKQDSLTNHVSLITKGTTPTSIGKEFQENGINFIKAESITDAGKFISSAFAFIDESTHEILKRSQLQDGDILFSIAGVLGRIAVVDKDILPANTNQAIAIIRLSSNSEIENDFLKHLLNSEFVKEQIRRINVQAAQANFSLADINRLQIQFPEETKEQTKIAKILSTADVVIEKTQAAIAKYKAIKQGMLHDLFTRGIDLSTNKLRPRYDDAPELYKESKLGWIPREWEIKQLSELCTMKSGDGITSENIYELGDYPVYGGNGLRGFTSKFTHEGEYTLIGRQGALCGNITRVGGKFYASEHAVVVTPETSVELDWLSQKLFSMNLNQYSEATAQPGLSVFKILPLLTETPPFDEQQKIAERLKATSKNSKLLKII